MKIKFLILIVNLLAIFSIFAFDKNQLNGGWLTEENLQKSLNGDEYFNNLPTIQIGNNFYFYHPCSLVIDLDSKNPYIQIDLETIFNILEVIKITDTDFLLKVNNKYKKENSGMLKISFFNNDSIILNIESGNKGFYKDLEFSCIGIQYKYKLIGKLNNKLK